MTGNKYYDGLTSEHGISLRRETAYNMRKDGATWTAIARELGVSTTTAAHYASAHERLLQSPPMPPPVPADLIAFLAACRGLNDLELTRVVADVKGYDGYRKAAVDAAGKAADWLANFFTCVQI